VGLRSGADRFYYLVDGLGSVAALTDASGAVTHSYAYDPYGVTTETTSSAVANPWRYTGQYQDLATGLYKMGARYYQPELGAGPLGPGDECLPLRRWQPGELRGPERTGSNGLWNRKLFGVQLTKRG
jgi:uncharacterized protein RhaS with RHS repeats